MDLDPQSASEMTHPEELDSSKALLNDQGVGGGPNPGNLRPFPTIGGIALHSLAYEITQPLKTNHATFRDCCALPSVMAHTVYGVRFSLSLNKSTLYLPLCLSLNSFCDQTSRTWASLGPATKVLWIWAGFKSQSVVNGFRRMIVWEPPVPLSIKSIGSSQQTDHSQVIIRVLRYRLTSSSGIRHQPKRCVSRPEQNQQTSTRKGEKREDEARLKTTDRISHWFFWKIW